MSFEFSENYPGEEPVAAIVIALAGRKCRHTAPLV